MMSLYPSMKQGVASCMGWDYSALAGANSPAGFGDPSNNRRIGAPVSIAGAFFVPAMLCYGGCAWETFGSAGFLLSRFANLRTAASNNRLATIRGSSSTIGAPPMKHALSPSKARAAAYKAMAFAALHANSSLSVRLARYNAHMTKARSLLGGAQ